MVVAVSTVIVAVLGWLFFGGDPFCSKLPPFDLSPCSEHGECYAAAQCHCAAGWGPESKISGTALCSPPLCALAADHRTRCMPPSPLTQAGGVEKGHYGRCAD